jgi:hypothetical protein
MLELTCFFLGMIIGTGFFIGGFYFCQLNGKTLQVLR